RACAPLAITLSRVKEPRATHDGQVPSPRDLWTSTSPAYTKIARSMNTGTAHHIQGGNPSHSATEYKATKLMANATNPAIITPVTTTRIKRPESGFIRFGCCHVVATLLLLRSSVTDFLIFCSVAPSVSPTTRIVGGTVLLASCSGSSGTEPFELIS